MSVVEFAGQPQRPPVRAAASMASGVDSIARRRRVHGDRRDTGRAVDLRVDDAVVVALVIDPRRERRQRDARPARTLGLRAQRLDLGLDELGELLRLGIGVDQLPVLGAVGPHAFAGGAEDVGQVAPHLALVGHARQAAGAGQHAEQGNFGQAHGGGAVVDHRDPVAGQRQLVAAAGAGPGHGGERLQAFVARRILQAVARLVGELAEVHLPGVGGQAQHVDVGAGAPDLFLGALEHHHLHRRMLEADAVERVVQLDVHAQVVAVQLELVARLDAAVLVDVQLQARHVAVDRERPVAVLRGMGGEAHQLALALPEQQGLGHCIHVELLSGLSPRPCRAATGSGRTGVTERLVPGPSGIA